MSNRRVVDPIEENSYDEDCIAKTKAVSIRSHRHFSVCERDSLQNLKTGFEFEFEWSGKPPTWMRVAQVER